MIAQDCIAAVSTLVNSDADLVVRRVLSTVAAKTQSPATASELNSILSEWDAASQTDEAREVV